MKKQVVAAAIIADLVVVTAVLVWWQPWSTVAASHSPAVRSASNGSSLAEDFQEAHVQGDLPALTKLVCWDGVDDFTRQSVLQSLEDDLPRSLVGVSYLPTSSSDLPTYELNGVRYIPNLAVAGQLIARFESEDTELGTTTYLVGFKDGVPMIATAAPQSSITP